MSLAGELYAKTSYLYIFYKRSIWARLSRWPWKHTHMRVQSLRYDLSICIRASILNMFPPHVFFMDSTIYISKYRGWPTVRILQDIHVRVWAWKVPPPGWTFVSRFARSMKIIYIYQIRIDCFACDERVRGRERSSASVETVKIHNWLRHSVLLGPCVENHGGWLFSRFECARTEHCFFLRSQINLVRSVRIY